ncbi:DUF951 domain-containing protein [Mycoplasma marinum]|uniref:DUF951 domain-containing protein n=1 Tax=Mycoplasma marinum TaxID=1937190 RepID=UPI00104059A8|nr:DUF951 domain-containing protein [Mycoplasma marinum]
MIKVSDYELGTIVTLKKPHPSNTIGWEVIRLGCDIKLKSTTVPNTYIFLERPIFHKRVKEIIKK